MDTYNQESGVELPVEIFDTEYMSDFMSTVDSSDVSDVHSDDPEDNDDDGDENETGWKGKAWEAKVKRRKAEGYETRANAAHLAPAEKERGETIWEKRSKAFRSGKVSTLISKVKTCIYSHFSLCICIQLNEIYSRLDEIAYPIRAAKRSRGRGHPRSVHHKVDFGEKDSRAPAGKSAPFPFMVDVQWKENFEAQEGKPFKMAEANPDGFA